MCPAPGVEPFVQLAKTSAHESSRPSTRTALRRPAQLHADGGRVDPTQRLDGCHQCPEPSQVTSVAGRPTRRLTRLTPFMLSSSIAAGDKGFFLLQRWPAAGPARCREKRTLSRREPSTHGAPRANAERILRRPFAAAGIDRPDAEDALHHAGGWIEREPAGRADVPARLGRLFLYRAARNLVHEGRDRHCAGDCALAAFTRCHCADPGRPRGPGDALQHAWLAVVLPPRSGRRSSSASPGARSRRPRPPWARTRLRWGMRSGRLRELTERSRNEGQAV